MGDEPRILRVSHRFPTLYCENMASLLGDETLNLPPDEWFSQLEYLPEDPEDQEQI